MNQFSFLTSDHNEKHVEALCVKYCSYCEVEAGDNPHFVKWTVKVDTVQNAFLLGEAVGIAEATIRS